MIASKSNLCGQNVVFASNHYSLVVSYRLDNKKMGTKEPVERETFDRSDGRMEPARIHRLRCLEPNAS